MKANSLSISIPSLKEDEFFCNKNCSYCVSKMSGINPTDKKRFLRNIHKARHLAELAQVSSVVITGKTEPLTNMEMVIQACIAFKDFPLEVQTNGILLNEKNIDILDVLEVDTIAISIDSLEQMEGLGESIALIRKKGMTVRFTICLTSDILYLTNHFMGHDRPKYLINLAKAYGADQVSFRNLTIPKFAINTKESWDTQRWIKKDLKESERESFFDDYSGLLKFEGIKITELPFGAVIYMYNGVSCTYFDYCIQDTHKNDDIRSLIYYEDGHLSTTWYGSSHGRIF